MNLAAAIYALRWLINDTFRQTLAGKLFWILLSVSTLAIVFCLGLSVQGGTIRDTGEIFDAANRPLAGPNALPGELSLLFGAFKVDIHRGGAEEIHLILVVLATWVAGAFGLLLALVGTANIIPDFLQPSSAVVLLAKPLPRWLILLGKYLGVVLFVALQGLIFFLGTWVAIGTRTGIWNNSYLLGWPLMILQFAVFYSVSVLIAATWRSTTACILGILLFWFLSLVVNYGRYTALALPTTAGTQATPLSPLTRGMIELGYWLFPKPADYVMMLEDAISAGSDKVPLSSLPEFQQAITHGNFQPFLILATSVFFSLAVLLLAGRQLGTIEY